MNGGNTCSGYPLSQPLQSQPVPSVQIKIGNSLSETTRVGLFQPLIFSRTSDAFMIFTSFNPQMIMD